LTTKLKLDVVLKLPDHFLGRLSEPFSLEVPMRKTGQLLKQRIGMPKLDSMVLGRGRNQTIR